MDWNQLLNNFGVPVAVLFFLLFGLAIFFKWLAAKIIEPLVSGHLSFLAGVVETQKVIVKTQQAMVASLEQLNDGKDVQRG